MLARQIVEEAIGQNIESVITVLAIFKNILSSACHKMKRQSAYLCCLAIADIRFLTETPQNIFLLSGIPLIERSSNVIKVKR